jgi:hypothetical protein
MGTMNELEKGYSSSMLYETFIRSIIKSLYCSSHIDPECYKHTLDLFQDFMVLKKIKSNQSKTLISYLVLKVVHISELVNPQMKWNVMIASHPKFASRYYKATEYYQRIQE